jgi:hypothetical protein
MNTVYSPEKIVEILHSITKLNIDEFGELEVWFDDIQYPSVSAAFIPGSFTRELLELIAEHLAKAHFENQVLDGLGVVRMLVQCNEVPYHLKPYKRSTSMDPEWLAFLVPAEKVAELTEKLQGFCVSIGTYIQFERTSTNPNDY